LDWLPPYSQIIAQAQKAYQGQTVKLIFFQSFRVTNKFGAYPREENTKGVQFKLATTLLTNISLGSKGLSGTKTV
jgi:hypothetical protein